MRKAIRQIAVCAGLLLVFCLVCRFAFFRDYTAYIPIDPGPDGAFSGESMVPEVDRPEVVRIEGADIRNGYMRVRLRPGQSGQADLRFRTESGDEPSMHFLRVSRLHTVYDETTGGFNGDTVVLIAVTLFWFLVGAIMLWHFSRAKAEAFYAYSTIYYTGFSIFALVTGLTMALVTWQHWTDPYHFTMYSAYTAISGASTHFMMLTAPLILVFALAMMISNVALLRHNRPRFRNVLGILIGVLLLAGEAVGFYLFSRDFAGSEWEGRLTQATENTYATVFVYFECMLVGSVICGILGAHRKPSADRDFIIILGCWFRPDGSLPPLLQGRVDRAIAFWHRQKETTGKEAFLIPTGGRGMDEPIPEAEAMRRYLLKQGIPEERILPEPRAENTFQNMAFSREIIQQVNPLGKPLFVTTNYHVFRSGVWAAEAGIPSEGIGSRTVWWFWPNAFMRETVGLLLNRWWQELLFLLMLIAFFILLSLAIG